MGCMRDAVRVLSLLRPWTLGSGRMANNDIIWRSASRFFGLRQATERMRCHRNLKPSLLYNRRHLSTGTCLSDCATCCEQPTARLRLKNRLGGDSIPCAGTVLFGRGAAMLHAPITEHAAR